MLAGPDPAAGAPRSAPQEEEDDGASEAVATLLAGGEAPNARSNAAAADAKKARADAALARAQALAAEVPARRGGGPTASSGAGRAGAGAAPGHPEEEGLPRLGDLFGLGAVPATSGPLPQAEPSAASPYRSPWGPAGFDDPSGPPSARAAAQGPSASGLPLSTAAEPTTRFLRSGMGFASTGGGGGAGWDVATPPATSVALPDRSNGAAGGGRPANAGPPDALRAEVDRLIAASRGERRAAAAASLETGAQASAAFSDAAEAMAAGAAPRGRGTLSRDVCGARRHADAVDRDAPWERFVGDEGRREDASARAAVAGVAGSSAFDVGAALTSAAERSGWMTLGLPVAGGGWGDEADAAAFADDDHIGGGGGGGLSLAGALAGRVRV